MSIKPINDADVTQKLLLSVSNSSPTHSNHPPPQQQQHHQNQQQQQQLFVALYDFEAMESDELTLQAGDVIDLVSGDDANWWRGRQVVSGKEGLFPASFVEKYDGRLE